MGFQKGQPNPGFRPGQSGNPGGMPKAYIEVREAAREHTSKAIETLSNICGDERKPAAARVSAGVALLERAWGKPDQRSTIDVKKHVASDWSKDEPEAIIRNEELRSGGTAETDGTDGKPDSVH